MRGAKTCDRFLKIDERLRWKGGNEPNAYTNLTYVNKSTQC